MARVARYMAQFQCLGASCEDTCCGGWTIPLDEPTHRRLKVLAEHEPALERALAAAVELTPQGPDFARLRDDASGRCGMLDARGWCSIHARLGPEALSDVCATYPRYANEVDGELELFGTLSCPEVARLCLLHPGSLRLQPLSDDAAPRKLRNRFDTSSPYYQPFLLVRQSCVELLGRSEHTLDEKLFVLLWLASKLGDIVRADAPVMPLGELRSLFDKVLAPPVTAELVASYRTLELESTWVEAVLEGLLGESREPAGDAYAARGAAAGLTESARARVDECLTRYCVNHLYTTPYMLHRNLFEAARELVWRVAALRVAVTRRLSAERPEAAELDRSLIEVVYRFSRRVEHSDALTRLARVLEAQQLGSFAHSVCFLRT